MNELGDELAAHETTTAATTAPTSVNNQVREVKFRDSDLVEVNERTRTGTKASEDRKSALAEIEKSLTEWYNNGGHEVLNLFFSVFRFFVFSPYFLSVVHLGTSICF